jgi:hypothetical protein
MNYVGIAQGLFQGTGAPVDARLGYDVEIFFIFFKTVFMLIFFF